MVFKWPKYHLILNNSIAIMSLIKVEIFSKDIDFIEEHWKEDIRLGGYEIDPNMEV